MSHSPPSPNNIIKPKGILRNASAHSPSEVQHSDTIGTGSATTNVASVSPSEDRLDRKKVLENTRINAQLYSELAKTETGETEGDRIRKQIAEKKKRQGSQSSQSSDHLQWDEVNLYLTEQDKSSTMRIDEPKTPYEGGADPTNEYYMSDNEDEDDENNNGGNAGEVDEFALGDAMDEEQEGDGESPALVEKSLNGGAIIGRDEADEEIDDDEDEGPQMTAEERHKSFEEKRKQHYHLKAEALKHPVPIEDDE